MKHLGNKIMFLFKDIILDIAQLQLFIFCFIAKSRCYKIKYIKLFNDSMSLTSKHKQRKILYIFKN